MFGVYKKLFSYAPEKKLFGYLAILLTAISSFFLIASYYYFYQFLTELIVYRNMKHSKFYAVFIVSFLILYGLLYFLGLLASHLLAFRLETNLRKRGIDGLMKSSFAFFDLNSSGKIRKIIDDNAQETHTIVAHLIPDSTALVMSTLFMVLLALYIDIKIGIFLIFLILFGIFQIKLMIGENQFIAYYMESLEKLNSETVEYIRGMQVIKIFKTTVISFKNLYQAIINYSKFALKYAMSCRNPYIIFQLIFNMFVVIIIPISILALSRGESIEITLRNLVFFVCFTGLTFGILMKVMYLGMYQYLANAAVDKIENLYSEMLKDTLKYGNIKEFNSYDIEFENVTFKYEEEPVLTNLSFKLNENKTYAFVGESGSGKSTIAKLISGFYHISNGNIKIGGRDISEYSKEALMKNIAFVFQNSKLFKISIYENVKIGNPNATREQVMSALSLACCDEIIAKFKDRENTIIGSKGVHLSGGEKQRIAIARAILKDSKIIILDEASAATDPENEYEIQRAFSNLIKGKTAIMIAHRLSSIRNVDEILVIQNGDIIERGTDKELMTKDSKYKYLQTLYSSANDWRVVR